MTEETKTFKEFLKDNREGIITDFNNPKCDNCNECCSMGTVITEKEYKRIKKYITTDVNGIALYKQGKELILRYLKDNVFYYKCPFSKEYSKKCGIYHIRPQICRDFHCKAELNKQIGRPEYDPDGYTIMDLFIKRNRRK